MAKVRKYTKNRKIPKIALINDLQGEFGRALSRGVIKYARLYGPWTFHGTMGGCLIEEIMGQVKTKNWIKDWGIDGIIVRDWISEEIVNFIPDDFPVVVFPGGNPVEGVVNVLPESFAIGKMAAEYLIGLGFTQFAYCCFEPSFISRTRGEGFEQTVVKAGFEYSVFQDLQGMMIHFQDKQRIKLTQWLKSLPKPIGMFVYNDVHANYIVDTCKVADIHVPDEIAVIGVDNDPMTCELANPPLSSIALNVERPGYEAAEQLARMIAGKKPTKQKIYVYPTHVAPRQSTDILAIADADVAKAVRFIHENHMNPIQVNDVVDEVMISRRTLYKRFKEVVGRSIKEEIRRIHVDYLARLLVETNMTIAQISMKLGYSNDKHMARYFSQIKGASPLAYRRKFGNK